MKEATSTEKEAGSFNREEGAKPMYGIDIVVAFVCLSILCVGCVV